MNTGVKWILGISATIVLLKIMSKVNEIVWDQISLQRINTLHPMVRAKAIEFINKAEAQGIKLRITSAYRTYEEQTLLYNQGRTIPGSIVTNAQAGQSSHNFGTAIDVIPMVNGLPDWNTKQWPKIAAIGKALGFVWGGDFKSIKDNPHFEMNFGKTLVQLRQLHDAGKVKDGYVVIA